MWNRRHVNQFLPPSAFIVTASDQKVVAEGFPGTFRAVAMPDEHGLHIEALQFTNRSSCPAQEFYVLSPSQHGLLPLLGGP